MPNRFLVTLLLSGFLSCAWTSPASAQDASEAPLGDVARNFRKKSAPPTPTVIHVDDDNLSKAVEDAAARRASGASVFSLDAQKNDAQKNDAQKNDSLKKRFDLSSPDVSCSLNFTAKTTSPFSDSLLVDDLPRAELAKLDGPAIIDGDSLQVSLHNGTTWELREVVIGLTIVRQSVPSEAASINQARIVPAAGTQADQDSYQKQPDVTVLLHVKGSAPSFTTATFRTPLNFALFPDQEWHWAIVRAKGIPPQTPPELTTLMQNEAASPPNAAVPDAGTKPSAGPSTANRLPANPDPTAH
jgi:hypothetical protein